MQGVRGKIVEGLVSWALPIICAGLIVVWGRVPDEIRHYWPVALVCMLDLWFGMIALQNRSEIRKLRAIHEKADAQEEKRRAIDDSIAKAFRAMLDDDMGNLYAACVARGYTTEDERRRYERLHRAYEGIGGNGEAKRRYTHFFALPDEAEWRAMHKKEEEANGESQHG